jgi:hypothetical protein
MKIIINTITIVILLLMVNCSKMILLSVHYRSFKFASRSRAIGKTAANPNGDGSGKVYSNCRYAISYKFVFPDGTSSNAPSGVLKNFYKSRS